MNDGLYGMNDDPEIKELVFPREKLTRVWLPARIGKVIPLSRQPMLRIVK